MSYTGKIDTPSTQGWLMSYTGKIDTSSTQDGSCLIYVICVCPTHIVLCFCFFLSFVPCVARFSGLSIFD